ncbi:hypothetical protein DICVIV_07785 [Dictyocaulus viviparus]|uniref:Uncharacterized protein n=1 Tax=Dictyocaulus viviparus TaxID=29172 RepID=A0A0D8XQT5_DICVI|nr:hypothetical protein DICVIV_07785 [Dictyocaulus viviparus]
MVLLAANIDVATPAPCELKLESGRFIRYVAPKDANPRKEMLCQQTFGEMRISRRRKSSGHDAIDQMVCWEGVNSLCHVLDAIIEIDKETDFFEGKSVLEIGFATGLPSVFAYENGANEVTLHSPSKSSLDLYCIPTLRRNAIPENKCKFSSGDLSQMRKAIGGKKAQLLYFLNILLRLFFNILRFDVILAAELLNRSEDEFDKVLQILDEALSHDGVCFLSTPTHYFSVDSNLVSFIDRMKMHRKFDGIERWSSPRTDVVQSKVIQLTRSHC